MKRLNNKNRLTVVLMCMILLVLPVMQTVLGGEKANARSETTIWTSISDEGEFSMPNGVAVSNDGTIYAANSGQGRMMKKSPSKGSIWEDISDWDDFMPYGVAVGNEGTVYVTGDGKIKKLPSGGSAWEEVEGPEQAFYPLGVAVDTNGTLYATSSLNQIFKLPKGSQWEDITGVEQFYQPNSVAVDSDGTLYVADTYHSSIKKLRSGSGVWEDITGSERFSGPYSVAVGLDGTVYVADTSNNNIKILPSGDSSWEMISESVGFRYPRGVAVDKEGNIYATDNMTGLIKKRSAAYTVSFDNNEGLPAVESQIVAKDAYSIEPEEALTKSGFVFGGWYSTSDFSGTPFDFTTTEITMDRVLYAKWLGPAKAVTVFDFVGLSPAVTGTIDEANKTIALTVPYGTNVASLIPTFTTTGASVKVGSAVQVSGMTPQDFTAPVTYTVVAEDESTAAYIVTVTVALPILEAPSSLVAAPGDTQIHLTWPTVSGATYYNVYQSADHTTFQLISTPANVTSGVYQVTGLTNGTLYDFKVSASNMAMESAYSMVASATPNRVYSDQNGGGTPALEPVLEAAEPKEEVFRSQVVNTADLVQAIKTKVAEARKENFITEQRDTKGHWAEQTINKFIKLHVIEGYGDGQFKPDGPITRAEFATLIYRVFTIHGDEGHAIALSDVKQHWAKEAIEKLANAGILNGYGDGTFKPDQTISREEIVAILSRIVNLDQVSKDTAKGQFMDMSTASTYAAGLITDAAEAGIISGKKDGVFDPQGYATRAESLTIILNALHLDSQIKTILDSFN